MNYVDCTDSSFRFHFTFLLCISLVCQCARVNCKQKRYSGNTVGLLVVKQLMVTCLIRLYQDSLTWTALDRDNLWRHRRFVSLWYVTNDITGDWCQTSTCFFLIGLFQRLKPIKSGVVNTQITAALRCSFRMRLVDCRYGTQYTLVEFSLLSGSNCYISSMIM